MTIPPLHTDWTWPDGCCPYYRTAYKKRAKTFVRHHGSIYQPIYRDLRAALKYDDDHENDPDDNSNDVTSHILPAFFTTLRELPAARG